MKRLLIRLGLVAGLALGFVIATEGDAFACHWKGQIGENCPNEPEDQPFNPILEVSLSNRVTGNHPNVDLGWTQTVHEQFVVRLVGDAPAGFEIDLDAPALDEQIGSLNITARISGVDTPLDGELFDKNDGVNWPSNGVYLWDLLVHGVDSDFHIDVFVDTNAPDGHLHLESDVAQDLIDASEQVNASVLEFTLHIDGETDGGDPFLTNPSQGGDYEYAVEFTPRDEADNAVPGDPPVTSTDTVTIEDRVPTTVTVTPANQTKRVGQNATVTAEVKDQDGVAMQGETVTFQRTGANPGSGSGTTNAQGKATHTYTGNNIGDDTVTATVAVVPGETITDSSSVHWIEPTTLTLAPAAATKTVHQQHSVTATVKDQDGNPMQGETVSFTVTGANPASDSKVTGADGKATLTYTGNATGSDSITASVSGTPASGSATAEWVNPTLTASPATANLVEDQQHSVTATVKDNTGAAMAGETVRFEVSGANSASEDRTTNAEGQATFTYTGANPGDDTIAVSVLNTASSTSVTAHFDAAVATALVLTPEETSVNTGNEVTLTARITDQINRPMAGLTVQFQVTAGPQQGQQATKTTNANGEATFTYEGQEAGDDDVQATHGTLADTSVVHWSDECQQNDPDCDGIPSQEDNCAFDYNPGQENHDNDGLGDACDNDDDNDALLDWEEAPNGCDQFDPDTDDDGEDDKDEVTFNGTDCADPDTDDDGLNDGGEETHNTDPNDPDSDDDGLTDGDEVHVHGTNPNDTDSDNDTLSDFDEVMIHGTDPNDTDSDDDGLWDDDEVNQHGTDPNDADTDDDGLDDGDEVGPFGEDTDPLDPDTDDDGLLDGEEVHEHGTDPNDADTDGDGLSDFDEIHVHGTDPNDADGDDDGLNDGDEIAEGTDAADPDTDNDGLEDGEEVHEHETDPLDPDTDDDGLNDGDEIDAGTDPLDPDTDDDEVLDGDDNCPTTSNPNQADEDGDGIGDACEDPIDDLVDHLVDDAIDTAENASDQLFDEVNAAVDLLFDTLPF